MVDWRGKAVQAEDMPGDTKECIWICMLSVLCLTIWGGEREIKERKGEEKGGREVEKRGDETRSDRQNYSKCVHEDESNDQSNCTYINNSNTNYGIRRH